MRILVIEDNPGDAEVVREILRRATGFTVQLEVKENLSSGLERLRDELFDLVLLDLHLPDSEGIPTLVQVNASVQGLPIVVLTGMADEDLGTELIRRGAQDYLVKGKLDSELLIRTIRYAIERNRLQMELDKARLLQQEERELRHLERFGCSPDTAPVFHLNGEVPLREGFPGKFSGAVTKYSELLNLAVERRDFKVEHDITSNIREVAEDLGFCRCGPGDVIDLHLTAMAARNKGDTQAKLRADLEEGRFLLIELLGDLLSFYRNYYIRYLKSRLGLGDEGRNDR